MAEWHSTPQAAVEPPFDFRKATSVAGAVTSLALVLGIGVWGYKLVVRDVSGVPVVRAAEGPVRIQPEDPGGQQAQHQGLSVNTIAAVGEASKPADRLVLAPAPLELTLEDTPRQHAQPATGDESAAPNVELTPDAEAADAVPADDNAGEFASFDPAVSGEATAAQTAPEAAADPGTGTDTNTDADPELATPVTEGLGRSLRPRLRPAQLASVGEAVALQVAAARPVDPERVPEGTDMAQLGAFGSEAVAEQEWTRLSGLFSSYLDDKQRVIQKAESGGRTFYRLRALGFENIDDARRFCSALVAEGAECIPVVNR
ncbi:MAG: SPOR domain-containing protein [Pseudomonadota bacterium]